MSILERIQGHQDLVSLSDQERTELCGEIREFLISSVSKTGGHLAGNLGTVELSVALETVFDTNKDRLVFDVGHQSYVHKLLTGRQADFAHLRQFGGMSGYPRPSESPADAFVAGHASSSVSIALGMACARTMLHENYNVIALTGDGAATGGMIYEGLNNVAVSKEPMIIVLNDNEMAIGKNVGGMSRHLSKIRYNRKYLRAKRRYRELMKKIPGGEPIYRWSSRVKNRFKRMVLPATVFQNMGLTYLGPADGHDLPGLIDLLQNARDLHEPVLLHVVTKKGKGYRYAEEDPAKFHGIGAFDPKTGKKLGSKVKTYSDSFGEELVKLADEEPRLCAITAAMPGGTGMLNFMNTYPDRYFDVGIAEEHAVSMAGGLAKQGAIPVLAIYSTFLQRGFDQVLQDISMLHLHVVIAIDRAGLVGDDGPTHHGVFDVGYLSLAPGMLILSPASLREQQEMLRWAVLHYDGPVAIRYPRGGEAGNLPSCWQEASLTAPREGSVTCCRQGKDLVLVSYGSLMDNTMKAAELLEAEGISATVLRLMTLSPLPARQILSYMGDGQPVLIPEEVSRGAGIQDRLAAQLRNLKSDCLVAGMDLGPDFVPHGKINQLYEYCGVDAKSIAARAKELLVP